MAGVTTEQPPAPSVDLTPDDLDTALIVVVIRDDGRSRLWIGDGVTPETARGLIHAAAAHVPPGDENAG